MKKVVVARPKLRKMLWIADEIHAQLKLLAEKNDRPMSREIRAAVIKHLRESGLWPPAQKKGSR